VSRGRDGAPDAQCSYIWPESESWHDIVMVDGSYVSAPLGWVH